MHVDRDGPAHLSTPPKISYRYQTLEYFNLILVGPPKLFLSQLPHPTTSDSHLPKTLPHAILDPVLVITRASFLLSLDRVQIRAQARPRSDKEERVWLFDAPSSLTW